MESRARSLDISKHKYYDLLYAFHIKRNNFRAGSIHSLKCFWVYFFVVKEIIHFLATFSYILVL